MTGAGTVAGAGVGALASKTALQIRYKSSLEYLGILVAATGALARDFVPKSPAGWLNNLSPDSRGGEESEGVAEGRSRRERPRPRIEVILELVPSKTLFQTGWLTR